MALGAAGLLSRVQPGVARQSCFGDPGSKNGGARWQGVALGAPSELRIVGVCDDQAQDLLQRAAAEIRRLDALFSLYRPSSAISRLNSLGFLHAPPPEFVMLLALADRIHTLTHGVFDPTIQPLWALYAETAGKPDVEQLARVRASVGWEHVRFNLDEVRLRAPGAALSLNGIAQGFVTDRIAEFLIGEGVRSALVKVGEIRVIGLNEHNRPWRIGLAEEEDDQAAEFLSLEDRAVATSAYRATTFDGYASHILDPRNGLPARPRWQRISVVGASAALCDGIATGAMLLEASQISGIVRRLSPLQIYAIDEAGRASRFPPGAERPFSSAAPRGIQRRS